MQYNQDIFIIATAILIFIIFFVAHIIFLRINKDREPVYGIITIFLVTGAIGGAFEWFFIFTSPGEKSAVIISLFSYLFIFIAYMLGVFGMMMSSLRLRMLSEIAGRGKTGISEIELLEIYNRDKIIKSRLSRFIQSGDMEYKNRYYYIKKPFSIFELHGLIFTVIKKLYGIK